MAGVSALAALLLVATPAAAQDPYGPTSTDPPSVGSDVTCSLDLTAGDSGDPMTATVHDVPAGELVRLLFGGVEVGRVDAPGTDPDALTTVTIEFTIPSVPSGDYLVAAVGSTFTADCAAHFVVDVGGETIERPGGSGPLPSTGIYVGLLLAVALVCLLVGRSLLEASRRRRRAMLRAEREALRR